jgi:hypothetical protein
MLLTELLPELQKLDRVDKLRAMQVLVHELAKEEDALIQDSAPYPVWSPYNSFEAAEVLLKTLESNRANA